MLFGIAVRVAEILLAKVRDVVPEEHALRGARLRCNPLS